MFFLTGLSASKSFSCCKLRTAKQRAADAFGLWMQRRSNLLVTELVEGIGFVGSELMTELGKERGRLVSLAEGGVGPSQQVRCIARVALRVGVETARNLQIRDGISRAPGREQSLATKYPGRDRIWIQPNRLIEFGQGGTCIGWFQAKDTLRQDVVEVGVHD